MEARLLEARGGEFLGSDEGNDVIYHEIPDRFYLELGDGSLIRA